MHVQCISRVSLSSGGNRLCHLQEEITDSRSDQFLAFNNNNYFFCHQRKLSNTVTSEILCVGRKKPKPEMWPLELFWGNEVREILYPPNLDILSLSSLHSMALLRMNSKVKFQPKCPVCFSIISLPCFLHWAFNASAVGLSAWKPFSPVYIFLHMICSLEKEERIYLEKPVTLFRIVSEPIHICPESFKELTCWVKWEFGVRFSVWCSKPK